MQAHQKAKALSPIFPGHAFVLQMGIKRKISRSEMELPGTKWWSLFFALGFVFSKQCTSACASWQLFLKRKMIGA